MRPDSPKGPERYNYTQGSIGRGIVRLAVPSSVEEMAWITDGFVEVFWVGRLGPEFLAAMAIGFMVIQFLRSFGLGIRSAGQALVAQRVGAGDAEGASIIAAQLIGLAVFWTFLAACLGIGFSEAIVSALSRDERIVLHGTQYLRAGFVALVLIESCFSMTNVLRGAGEPVLALLSMLCATALTVVLVPLLIFGFGPIPGLGLAGAFLGIGFGRIAGIGLMVHFLTSGRSCLRIRVRHFRPDVAELGRLLGLGWPVVAQLFFERSANFVLVALISRFGALSLAAWGIGNRVAMYSRMPAFGLQSAGRTMVGQNIGAGLPRRAWRSACSAVGSTAGIMVVVTGLLMLFAHEVVAAFGVKGEAAQVAALCLRILVFGTLFEGPGRVLAGVFQGASQTKPPMVVDGIVRWGVQIPGALLATAALGLAAEGVWGAIALSQGVGFTALFLWFWSGELRQRLSGESSAS